MPSRNIIKTYVADGIYHVYNRGVEKRDLFMDHQDYTVYLRFLKDALTPRPDPLTLQKNITVKGSTFKGIARQPKNFLGKIELLCFCLMPNHFHLLLKQQEKMAIKEFMHSICTRYSMYLNNKYKRVGTLFQNIYKAALVMEEPYLLHLTRYIHRNPLPMITDLVAAYSSYGEYLKLRRTSWVHPELILSFFTKGTLLIPNTIHTYQDFVETYETESATHLGSLALDEDPDL